MDWSGMNRSALPARTRSLLVPTLADQREPRSPLRRCFKPRPMRRAWCAGFASGCRSEFLERLSLESLVSPGGWRASCPATYRPTRDHRHVRNWASVEIIYSGCVSSIMRAAVQKNFRHYESVNVARVRETTGAASVTLAWRGDGGQRQSLPYFSCRRAQPGSPTTLR